MALGQGSFVRSLTGSAPDDRRRITFSKMPVQDEAATNAHGRPIFRDVEMIEIAFPGNQLNIWSGRVTDEHRQMYSREYEAFLKGEEAPLDGTPIEELTVLNKSQVKELKYLDIHTIEDAAALTDYNMQTLGMGGMKLRELARRYLEKAEGLAPLAELVAVKENLEGQNALLKTQLEEMNRTLTGLQHQLNTYAQAPKTPETVIPYAPDPHGLGTALPIAGAGSSLDSIGESKPTRRKPGPKPRVAA